MDGLGDKLTFISASAGTGKTYQLVETIHQSVSSGTARAEGVIATTFSNAAANELRERVAARFHGSGLHEAAEQLDEGLIGTVHSICLRLLQRFAFEAGTSPELRILDDTETRLLLDRALDLCVDETRQLELCRLGDRLEQRDLSGGYRWRKTISDIIGAARTNDIAPEALAEMGTESWNDLARALPPETEEDLDALLRGQIESALAAIPVAEKPKNSAEYRQALTGFLRSLEQGRIRWSDWASLQGKKPAKEYHPLAEAVAAVADRVSEHDGFRKDVRIYLEQLFTIAGSVAQRFQELKRERGAVDFDDMEKEALDLLRGNESVRAVLREEIDLLLVDEFQDTSPMQLAVFAELGKLAGQIVWVGDVKQSIYEFRGADPDLVFQAVRAAKATRPLTESRRSTPELVSLANQLFADAFADCPEITAHRGQPEDLGSSLQIASIVSNELKRDGAPRRLTADQRPGAVAEVVRELLESGADPRDVAILTREQRLGDKVGGELRRRGIDVARASKGLLETAEARLAMACLRRLTDRGDSLASAEIVALENLRQTEEWITDRLEFLRDLEGDEASSDWAVNDSPALASLEAGGDDVRLLSPLAAFDRAMSLAAVSRIVAAWGPSQARAMQRSANLERLRGFVQEYEIKCGEFGIPATLNCLFGWLEQLSADGLDKQGIDPDTDAVHIETCHSSKGREWPIVVVTDPGYGLKTRLFDLRVVGPEAARADNPLAGRTLRLWINPFRSRISFHERLEDSEIGKRAKETAHGEELRLLYVTLTRARDRMVIVHESEQPTDWLDEAGGAGRKLLERGEGRPGVTIQRTRHVLREELAALPASGEIEVPVYTEARTARPPAVVTPSAQVREAGARVLNVHEFGTRLLLKKHPNERDLGDAIHRILAAEAVNPGRAGREGRIADILAAFRLSEHVETADVARMVDRYREFLRANFGPRSETVEVPFAVTNADGQSIHGLVDHLLQTSDGPIIIDHKIFPGRQEHWESKALSYAGQLACYRDAVGGGARTFIHLASLGVLLEIGSPADETPTREGADIQGTFEF